MQIYHSCGAQLFMESQFDGQHFIAEFYDPTVKDRAERVCSCPRCGEALGKMPNVPNADISIESISWVND